MFQAHETTDTTRAWNTRTHFLGQHTPQSLIDQANHDWNQVIQTEHIKLLYKYYSCVLVYTSRSRINAQIYFRSHSGINRRIRVLFCRIVPVLRYSMNATAKSQHKQNFRPCHAAKIESIHWPEKDTCWNWTRALNYNRMYHKNILSWSATWLAFENVQAMWACLFNTGLLNFERVCNNHAFEIKYYPKLADKSNHVHEL